MIPKRGVVRFGKREKLSPRFIGPFEILERIGVVAYRLALPPSMSGVHEVFHVSMLQKYTPNPTHVVDWGQIEVDTDGTFEEGPVCILDSRDQVLLRKIVRLVRVLWRHMEWRSQRGSARTRCGPPIPSCLGMKVRGLVEFTCMVECTLHMQLSDVIVQNFGTKFLLRRGDCKTRQNPIFSKRAKL